MEPKYIDFLNQHEADVLYTTGSQSKVCHIRWSGHAWLLCQQWPDENWRGETPAQRHRAYLKRLCAVCERKLIEIMNEGDK